MHFILQAVLVSFLICGFYHITAETWLDPDTGLNLYQFIDNHGYYYENYSIVTEDNYILNTVRIPRGKNENTSTNTTKPATLLLHGILSNPEDLIILGDSSIGFLLAEHGFDVYLMASRGNTYSVGHKTLSRDSVAYWNFSWHEVGYYDIPANMDLITNLTGNVNISFIGHSQGGTAFVALAATRPEYRIRISAAHLFAPVVYMKYARLPFFDLIKKNNEILQDVLTDLKLNKGVLSYNPFLLPIAILFCSRDAPTLRLCVDLLGQLCGPDPIQINSSLITVLSTNDPAGASFNQFFHFLQIARTNEFRLFDYRSNNFAVYNQSKPPFYDLSSVRNIPIYVWYGYNDYFAGVQDYQRLIKELPCAISKLVNYSLWSHIDFFFGIEAQKYVYSEVISNLQDVFGLQKQENVVQ
ncbi:lipase 3-like [Euwallacea fornicatus]|uniref:lipase 3-like n=1 Tax=Euwallacea fornicatus TaxID=995702 RepID=UPI00338F7106